MLQQDTAQVLTALGATPEQASLYAALLAQPHLTPDDMATREGRPRFEVEADLDALVERGLLARRGELVDVVAPARVLPAALDERASALDAARRALQGHRGVVDRLQQAHEEARMPSGNPLWFEVLGADDPGKAAAMMSASQGEMLWLRPDNWRYPWGRAMDRLVADEVRSGRRSRALYPIRVLEEAPEVVRERAEAGEEVRLVATVPFRLAVTGSLTSIAEGVGPGPGRWVVVRHPQLIAAMRLLFEHLWAGGMSLPGLDDAGADERQRRVLLDLLARGTKDEQMARSLGVSLRTVRRRIADLLDELGADSRFQAGVEAVRRQWV